MRRSTPIVAALVLLLGGVGQAKGGFVSNAGTFSTGNSAPSAEGGIQVEMNGDLGDDIGASFYPDYLEGSIHMSLDGGADPDSADFGTGYSGESALGYELQDDADTELPGAIPSIPPGSVSQYPGSGDAGWSAFSIQDAFLGTSLPVTEDDIAIETTQTTANPEPSSLALFGMATVTLAGYCGWRRRRRAVTP